jgi:hypothetical protein
VDDTVRDETPKAVATFRLRWGFQKTHLGQRRLRGGSAKGHKNTITGRV